jgi:hypothetical protein
MIDDGILRVWGRGNGFEVWIRRDFERAEAKVGKRDIFRKCGSVE